MGSSDSISGSNINQSLLHFKWVSNSLVISNYLVVEYITERLRKKKLAKEANAAKVKRRNTYIEIIETAYMPSG